MPRRRLRRQYACGRSSGKKKSLVVRDYCVPPWARRCTVDFGSVRAGKKNKNENRSTSIPRCPLGTGAPQENIYIRIYRLTCVCVVRNNIISSERLVSFPRANRSSGRRRAYTENRWSRSGDAVSMDNINNNNNSNNNVWFSEIRITSERPSASIGQMPVFIKFEIFGLIRFANTDCLPESPALLFRRRLSLLPPIHADSLSALLSFFSVRDSLAITATTMNGNMRLLSLDSFGTLCRPFIYFFFFPSFVSLDPLPPPRLLSSISSHVSIRLLYPHVCVLKVRQS